MKTLVQAALALWLLPATSVDLATDNQITISSACGETSRQFDVGIAQLYPDGLVFHLRSLACAG